MKFKYGFTLLSAGLLVAACGVDVLKSDESGLVVVESLTDDIECTRTNVGEMIFVLDSNSIFYCADKAWHQISVNLAVDGENGDDGDDGDNCSISDTLSKDGLNGFNVTCAEERVGTLWNGADAEAGEDGVNCEVISDEDGVVNVKCGENTAVLYKAVCGGIPYDPEKRICENDSLYDLCDGKFYSYKKEFCVDDKIYEKCLVEELCDEDDECVQNPGYVIYDVKKYTCKKYPESYYDDLVLKDGE